MLSWQPKLLYHPIPHLGSHPPKKTKADAISPSGELQQGHGEGGGEDPTFFNPLHSSLTGDGSCGLLGHPTGFEPGPDCHQIPALLGAKMHVVLPLHRYHGHPPLPPPMLLLLVLLLLWLALLLLLLLLLLRLLLSPLLLLGRGVPIGGRTPTAMGMKMLRAIVM